MDRKEVKSMRIKKGTLILGALGSAFAIGATAIGILTFINPTESMAQGLPVNATMQFGNTGVGSGFPPQVVDFTEGTHLISTKGTIEISGAKRRSDL